MTLRSRRTNALPKVVADLLDEFATPIPTHAVRILLADRGRVVAPEHLSRTAANEREVFERTRMPPLICCAINPDASVTRPRWWARTEWRLQRRILTEDASPVWHAMLAERLCWQFSHRSGQVGEHPTRLALWAISRLGLERDFELPLSTDGWLELRSLVVNAFPVVTHSLDGPTEEQRIAEERLRTAGLSAADLYFGTPRNP